MPWSEFERRAVHSKISHFLLRVPSKSDTKHQIHCPSYQTERLREEDIDLLAKKDMLQMYNLLIYSISMDLEKYTMGQVQLVKRLSRGKDNKRALITDRRRYSSSK